MELRRVALFIDIDHVLRSSKTIYNRDFDPTLLIEKARKHGLLDRAHAYADFTAYPAELRQNLVNFGVKTIQVERELERRIIQGQARDVLRESKDIEILADVFETLMDNPAITTVLLATGDRYAARALTIARNKFGREVVLCGVAGAIAPELLALASSLDPITLAPAEPRAAVSLGPLITIVEALESKKRYLNFKFIREQILNAGKILGLSNGEEADALLSDAIECGLLNKRKIEDKYHPSQFFTAYTLNRESAVYLRERGSSSTSSPQAAEANAQHDDDATPRLGRRAHDLAREH